MFIVKTPVQTYRGESDVECCRLTYELVIMYKK